MEEKTTLIGEKRKRQNYDEGEDEGRTANKLLRLDDTSPCPKPSRNRAKQILGKYRKLLQKELDELSLGDALKRVSGHIEWLFSEENLKQDKNLKANLDDKVSFKKTKKKPKKKIYTRATSQLHFSCWKENR